ncbi:MAG TPA: PEP-CTERM sorting domain-containing protein, partial [Tepidisphaeraceae bacterium]|nr:PEP-CTERM sorting domain-containing protein [Tepidisphaeraceae bacterium]
AAAGVAFNISGGGNAVITPASTTSLQTLTGITVAGSNMKITAAHAAIVTTGLNVDATSTLDLTNNDLIVDYADGNLTTGPAVVALVQSAYDHGAWDGLGVTSSMASIASGTTLAVVDNANNATPLVGMVDGVTLDGSSVAVKYTWYGDTNLDGIVDSSDLTTMTNDLGSSGVGWNGGDLNYDGIVNSDDLGLFMLGLAEYNAHGQQNISSVPEPSAALMLIGLGALATRRRRA